ncbi:helix-turn-helix domain-containing protein [Roseomonas sp. GC11]|uniref:helix-turn-helix domain-containing protein n=1 Tax=Roseomonas sp. GC11 TaxID=2950546 RepID=UPI0021098221|nr:helix-turn-helix domain-containing protein [Roseomonas sp. GC11]MCQ4160447.1 helix-turn-helix domain-containing protein [Roseomonas sp. GC11]
MQYLLTAVSNTYLKSNRSTHSRDLAETDKLAAKAGEALEAAELTREGGYFVVRNAVLNGQAVPTHIVYALADHWNQTEQPVRTPASSEDKQARALQMLAAGQSVSAIAKELRIGRAFIKRWRDAAP